MTTATLPETATWQLDATHSSIGFSVKHLMIATVKGSFGKYNVSFSGNENDLSNATVKANIETASIDTGNDQRDGHLRSADFFEAEKYPEITFVGKKIVGDAFGEFKLIGDLSLHGVTKEIT